MSVFSLHCQFVIAVARVTKYHLAYDCAWVTHPRRDRWVGSPLRTPGDRRVGYSGDRDLNEGIVEILYWKNLHPDVDT